MNFKQLEAFYWLSKLHSHQRVAEHIGLTQPAVSARIAGLEDMVGMPLIDRSASGFQLTEQGHQVAEYAEAFLNLRETMFSRLQLRQRRRFVIGMVAMMAVTWGTTLRRMLEESHPDLLVDFHVSTNAELRQELRSGTIDMVFVTDGLDLPKIANGFVVRYRAGWVARPGLVPGPARPLTPEDLRTLPMILYPRAAPLFAPVTDLIDEVPLSSAPRHFANSLGTICDMVRAGFGASCLTLAAVEAELENGTLVELPTTVAMAGVDLRCAHMNRARKVLTAEIFALAREAAREWCAAHPRFVSFVEAPDLPAARAARAAGLRAV